MPGPLQACVADMHLCTVPAPATPPPFPAPLIPPCAITVIVSKRPAARALTDMTLNGVGLPHSFPKGSTSVVICKFPALRVADMCFLGGPVIPSSNTTVFTGG